MLIIPGESGKCSSPVGLSVRIVKGLLLGMLVSCIVMEKIISTPSQVRILTQTSCDVLRPVWEIKNLLMILCAFFRICVLDP